MSEELLLISNLNDFIFCPASIYFHSLDYETDRLAFQDECQINGSAVHEGSDTGAYSMKKTVLQAISVYCEKYGLFGKIDVFDTEKGVLTERKKKITTIYDGYVFQLYAQYFSLCEMGYDVKFIRLYSMEDNKTYDVLLPENDIEMLKKFETLISDIQTFSLSGFEQRNALKCKKCIYEPLCSFSCNKEETI